MHLLAVHSFAYLRLWKLGGPGTQATMVLCKRIVSACHYSILGFGRISVSRNSTYECQTLEILPADANFAAVHDTLRAIQSYCPRVDR